MPFFDGDIAELIAGDPDSRENFVERYFSEQTVQDRDIRRDRVDALAIVDQLERELREIALCSLS